MVIVPQTTCLMTLANLCVKSASVMADIKVYGVRRQFLCSERVQIGPNGPYSSTGNSI